MSGAGKHVLNNTSICQKILTLRVSETLFYTLLRGTISHSVCVLWFLLEKLMGIIEFHVLVTKMINRDLKVHIYILSC